MARRRSGGMVSRTMTLPTPTGGWNSRDAVDQMQENEAVILNNIFPGTTTATLRGGSIAFCNVGTNAPVYTLAQWDGAGVQKLIAGSGGSLFDITSGAPTSLASGFLNNAWQTTNFSGPAGTNLLLFNGVDTPQIYNGSTVTASTIASAGTAGAPSLTSTNLFASVMYASRLFVLEKGTMHVWYAQIGAYQGTTLNFLDMGAYATKGGSLAAIGTWNRINVYGQPIQLLVVATTEGELFIFQGTDPSNAADWQLEGQISVGPPVFGARCLVNLGSECIFICQDGFQPLSQYLSGGQLNAQSTAFSAKIGGAVLSSVQLFGTSFGWEACLYPIGNRILFNVPRGSGVFHQFVMNTITKAWCRYTNWTAYTFLRTFGGPLYFGGPLGDIHQAEVGTADSGTAIPFEYKSRFVYPAEGFKCLWKMARPVFTSSVGVIYNLQVDVDFQNATPTIPDSSAGAPVNVLVWGVGLWGQSVWGSSPTIQAQWQSVGNIGYAAAFHMAGQSVSAFDLHSVDLMFEPGGPL